MPLDYPTFDELVETARASLRNEIPTIDPTISNSWARAFVDSLAALAHSNNLQIRDLEKQLFPQTATDEYLDRWLDYEGLARNTAEGGRGNVTIPGVAGSVVPAYTLYTGTNGLIYESQAVATIALTELSVDTLTRSGTTVFVTFTASHLLATGNSVTIAGAEQTTYNGTFSIIVISETEFTYTVEGSPVTPGSGTITATSTYATVVFECTTTGIDTDLDSGAILTIDTSISGVDDESIVSASGLTGGADIEDDDSARERLFLSRSNRPGVFTADQIKLVVLSISGNTRVFVLTPQDPVGGGPEPGQVFIYFLRDNDTNPLPNSTLIAETKQAVIDFGKMPAHTDEADVLVAAPTPVYTDYTFASISPDTSTMQTAIEDQIAAFYQDSVYIGQDISESSYTGAIANTYDTVNGKRLASFSLTLPSGDITIASGEIGFPGIVSFS